MSNRTVIENLEKELNQYENGQFARDQIGKRLYDHVEALEGIPYSVILTARRFQYAFELDGYYFQEGCESKSDELISEIQNWLVELRTKYCTE